VVDVRNAPFMLIDAKAKPGLSLRPQTKLGNLKKADAQGYDPVFRCPNAAKVGSEAILQGFRIAANVWFRDSLFFGCDP
jgi:hypothetical protein